MFMAALFIIAKKWKQSQCPTTDEWTNKIWYIYTVACVTKAVYCIIPFA